MKLHKRLAAVSAAAALILTTGAWAHHSFALFDRSKTVTINGTIKKVEWKNPHVWIWVEVPKADGGSDLYALESGSPSQMQRMGAPRSKFQAGKTLTAVLYPIKDGRLAGQSQSFEFSDGTEFDVDKAVDKFVRGD